MRIKLTLLLICLLNQFLWSQTLNSKPLQGQVVTDSIAVDFGYVINLNSNIKSNIEAKGFFKIPAQEKDTLLFLGLSFESKKIILTAKDFTFPILKIKLKADVTKLAEVTVDGKKIKPNIANSQTIVDQQYFDDKNSSPQDPIIKPSGYYEPQINFVRLFKDLKKSLKKKKEEGGELDNQYTFLEIVTNTYNQSFFTETLKIEENDIVLFMVYCDNDANAQKFLKPHTKFELTNFLVSKNDEFKKLTNFDK